MVKRIRSFQGNRMMFWKKSRRPTREMLWDHWNSWISRAPEGGRSLPVGFRVDGERALPTGCRQEERRGEVLGQFGTDAADLAEGGGAHRVVRAVADGGEAVVAAGLGRPVEERVLVEPTSRRP